MERGAVRAMLVIVALLATSFVQTLVATETVDNEKKTALRFPLDPDCDAPFVLECQCSGSCNTYTCTKYTTPRCAYCGPGIRPPLDIKETELGKGDQVSSPAKKDT